MMEGPNFGVGVLLHILILLMCTGVTLAGWVFLLVTAWRGMKAHESLAESLRKIADRQEQLPPT